MADVPDGQKLECSFFYHQDEELLDYGIRLSNQFVITPYIVRQVIIYGKLNGWHPMEKGPLKRFGHLDDMIDLRLEQNKANALHGG